MGGIFKLGRLFSLSEDMLRHKIDYQVVNGIRYKNNLEICAIFKYDYKDINNKIKYDEITNKIYTLGLFKRGTREFLELPLEYEIKGEYKSFTLPLVGPNASLYKDLCKFLEIDYAKNGPFKPLDFFKALHNAIPTKASIKFKDRLACSYSYSYPTSKDNEQEKIYFRSFLNNDLNGNKRSLENKAKTEKLLPDAHKVIGTRNISVCFTHTPKDEQKEKEEIASKFNELQTQI
ncbi:DUF6037 family protein [Bacillus cereus group sp. MYBK12-2]|uniref:Uncharacterized protein n=2 Tax=Bacillus cereus group TaxID=86661 RepID=A0A150AXE7_BACCE|nr:MULTISPECIES: DUF6037 family protein [Bacillus cereus group]HDR7932671.1 hypothetical protein [Bacillus pacificus]EOP97561.1 hypothetical protein IIY_05412 [Bacillus cereus VD140]KMP82195.1 hypothetical protein TU63_22795 [Bacillus cereus]KXX87708.1 hypothetical protein AT274_24710 [Bacillus cereus]KZD38697.1 hypothetical protein B4081_0684 [Bacillus cereus]